MLHFYKSFGTKSLYKKWVLYDGLNSKKSIMNKISIHFYDNGTVEITDTVNRCLTTFTIHDNMIIIRPGIWTQLEGMWSDKYLQKESYVADAFIHHLIQNPFTFKLNNHLTIYYQENMYRFK